LLKGLPLAYDKDLQLDKEPLFRTREVLALALPSLAAILEGLTLERERMRALASRDLLLATELADAIASRGIPFREAHRITGERVAQAIREGKTLRELGPSQTITKEDLTALDVDRALARRSSFGGTSPDCVRTAARVALDRLSSASVPDESREAAS
jgi:argininosuccinate lyase